MTMLSLFDVEPDAEHTTCMTMLDYSVVVRGVGLGGGDTRRWGTKQQCEDLAAVERSEGETAEVCERTICPEHKWSTHWRVIA